MRNRWEAEEADLSYGTAIASYSRRMRKKPKILAGAGAPQAMVAIQHFFDTGFGSANRAPTMAVAGKQTRFSQLIITFLVGACLAGILVCGTAQAAMTWYVSPLGNDTGEGTSWVSAKRSIQAAVSAAGDGDTVLVTNGVYLLSSPVNISSAIQLTSVNGSSATILDGQQTQRCVTIEGVTATLSGFTIQNGRSTDGGGVYCDGGTIQNCLVVSNRAIGDDFNDGQGGGVYLANGVISNCVILSNVAQSTNAYQGAWGGGMYSYIGLVQGCLVSNNVCSGDNAYGGGVVLKGGNLRNSRIIANSGIALTGASGGGVYATIAQLSESALVDACVITGNNVTATDTWSYTAASANGGGLSIGNGTVLRSSLIQGNSARAVAGFTSGGGVWTSGSSLENCTVVYNNATTQNGNLGGGGGVTWGYNDQCYNSIIRFNDADNGPDNWEVNQLSYPTFINSDLGPSFPAANAIKCISADPMFVNTSGNDYRLRPGSPCLNIGTNLEWMVGALDLAGNSRLSGGVVDLGAYEYAATGTQPTLSALTRSLEGQCELLLNGVAGQTYTLQYSVTLTNWISLLVTNDPGGQMRIIDSNATNALRFYRVLGQ